jgi:hypothetical protein
LLNGYQEPEPAPEPAPEPELGSAPESETESTPQLLPLYTYKNYRIPENDIQYPGERAPFRLIPSTETNEIAIAKAKKLLNTTIDGKDVFAFVLFISAETNTNTNTYDRGIYLKSDFDNIERNPSSNTTIVYSFEKIPLPE